MRQLAGKTAVVTGGGSGIGRALALALAREGMNIAVADIRAEPASAVAEEVRSLGREATGLECDVSDRASVRRMSEQVQDRLGAVHVLCANAGVTSFKRLAQMGEDDWDWIFGVNVFGATNCIQSFLPGMARHREGHIVITSSITGLIPSWAPNHAAYTASKSLQIALAVNMRPELAELGIGCSVLCPGGVETAILSTPRYRPERFGGPADEDIPRPALPAHSRSAPKLRSPEEVAQMVIRGIREDEPIIVTDAAFSSLYHGYSQMVGEAFGIAAASEG